MHTYIYIQSEVMYIYIYVYNIGDDFRREPEGVDICIYIYT